MQVDRKQVENAIKRVSATQDGQILLAFLMNETKYNKNYINYDNACQTAAFAAMRGLWAKFRKDVPTDYLIEIEHRVEFVNEVKKEKAK